MAGIAEVCAAFEALAPLRFAASWDNVGLLLEGHREVHRVLCAIDLTEAVLDEALALGADCVLAYHPPIFSGLKRLTRATPTGRILLDASRAGIHVYTPHTALDAVRGGLADWLLEPFGELGDVAPIEASPLDGTLGFGRRATLATPTSLDALLPRIKAHLGLEHVRVAGVDRPVHTVGVCPGAGGSVFERVRDVDLLLTGEMRHHDVLARVGAGSAVVLTDHTHTERGYLPRFATALRLRLSLEVTVSAVDDDPLRIA